MSKRPRKNLQLSFSKADALKKKKEKSEVQTQEAAYLKYGKVEGKR